jgi:hypothetical protein
MSVHCPPVAWPDRLDEEGPVEDPGILLHGVARIGSAHVDVYAIRIHPGLRLTPDYREDVDQDRYAEVELDARLDELASLAGTDRPAPVELATGIYLVYVVPCATKE